MIKKAKLYSLLAIIVASTVVGLFGFTDNAYAACPDGTTPGQDCATWGRAGGASRNAITYNGGDYDKWSNTSPILIQAGSAYTCDTDGTDLFANPDNVYINMDQGIIYFDDSINGDSAKDKAETVHFLDITDPQPDGPITSVDRGAAPMICTSSNALSLSKSVSFDSSRSTSSDGQVDEEIPPPGGTSTQSCQIKGIGWLVCPIVNFLAVITDQSYNLLNKYLLKLEPIALPGSSQNTERMQLYDSWRMMRDFANIVFIIGFLVIVFSQITSIGIGNYGIKRLLPKIIIAAILVNLSYYICAVAVDLSNILGNSLRDALMPDGNALPEFGFTQDNVHHEASGFVGISDIVLGAVLTGAIVYAFLPVFLPLVVSAALAVITAVIVLTLRQALVVILIVVSPLAFVALLLPNTENYFQKWRSLFTSMLLIYPIISVVFGASALASSILMNATDDFWTQMVGAGVSVIPLFITPILMKISGGLLNRWVGIVNDPTKGPIDGMRNSLRDRGTLMKAGRAERTAGWVNSGRGSRVFGGANSWRRRAAASMTNYGSNNRDRTRKDNLAAAESNLESMYLGTEGGQAARNATKNAQINLQNSQINTETIRLNSAEGLQRQIDTTSAERQQETAKNNTNRLTEDTLRGSAVNSDLKESEVRLHTAELRSQTTALTGVLHADEGALQQAEIDKKAAEDHHAAGAATYVAQASRTAQMVAERERKAAEDRETAAATNGPALTAAASAAKDAELTRKAQESRLSAASQGSTIARVDAANASLEEKAAESLAAADTARGTSRTLANDAKSAENIEQAAKNDLDARAQGSAASRLRLARSQNRKEAADDNAMADTTIRLTNNTAAQRELGAREDASNRKQMADNDSKSLGIAMANEEFKIQKETSAETLSEQQSNDKRLYEEVVAGSVPAGVSATTALNAQTVRKAAAITNKATEGAKRVSTKNATEEILNDPTLAAQMAGIDPGGENRVRASAEAAQAQAEKEELGNSVQLLNYEAIRAGKTLKQYATEVLNKTISGTHTPQQTVEAALEAAAQDGQVSILREARMSGNVDQDTLTKVLARNAETMKAKGGYDLQNDPTLAGATPSRMRLSQAANLGDIASVNIPAIKAGEWESISKNITAIINSASAARGTSNDPLGKADDGLQKAYIALTEALRNPNTRAGLTDRMDETKAIHQALDKRFSGTVKGYTIDFTKPSNKW